MPEAIVEHGAVKALRVEPHGETYGAKVKVMGEFVQNHVKEQQNEMFSNARRHASTSWRSASGIAARTRELLV